MDRGTRTELSKLGKLELQEVYEAELTRVGLKQMYGGPQTKDELIWAILRLQEGKP